jgi:hypothetical protein
LLWSTLGQLIVIGPCIAYAKLQSGSNDLWDGYARGQGALPAGASAVASFAAE